MGLWHTCVTCCEPRSSTSHLDLRQRVLPHHQHQLHFIAAEVGFRHKVVTAGHQHTQLLLRGVAPGVLVMPCCDCIEAPMCNVVNQGSHDHGRMKTIGFWSCSGVQVLLRGVQFRAQCDAIYCAVTCPV